MPQALKIWRFAIQITGIAALAVTGDTACGYDVTFSDCEVRCTGSNDCPDGFSCQANLCRVNGNTGPCAAPGTVTLRQTGNDTIDPNLVFSCTNADTTTADTSWYRVFSLSDAGISGAFDVDKITLGLAKVVGMVTVQVAVGTYGGSPGANTLDVSKITKIGMASVPIMASGIPELEPIPITATIPGGANLIVEVDVADQNGTGNEIDIGSTDASQTHPAYVRIPLCGTSTPTTTTSASLPNAAFVLTVEGSGH